MVISDNEENVEEALSGSYAKEWMDAMTTEFKSLISNNVWKLKKCPADRAPIGCRRVLKIKYNADGSLERRKARLVAKGYAQQPGIDFKETFAPVARFSSIRIIVALAAEFGLDLFHLDITMAYTYGDLNEDIFMDQAEFFVEPGQEEYVYHLQKSLYGLKQAGRQWNERLDAQLLKLGFIRIDSLRCIYIIRKKQKLLLLVVYVDDLS